MHGRVEQQVGEELEVQLMGLTQPQSKLFTIYLEKERQRRLALSLPTY